MLHFNKDGAADLTLASKTEEIVWKVLILDARSQAILSLVLRVNDLLRCGVTVHLTILARRSPLPDVAAVYFVEPSVENVAHIIDDLASDKYDSFYINFTSSINRELLEEFAKKVSLAGKASKIKQVYDQYLDFVVTEPNLFLLNVPRVFTRFNDPSTSEDAIHALADSIAAGLLALVVTQGHIPIIRCPRSGPAELVATALDLRLRDYVANAKGVGSGASLLHQRPVLVILDRNIDVASMFSHLWIYQCMVSDVFELKRNTIRVSKYDDEKVTSKSYDVDPRDFFWNKNAQLPFPDVVENADVELNLYKRDAQELTAKTGVLSLKDLDPGASLTAHIQQAVDALPELTARKATLDMHMDVLASLLKELEARLLDKFFEIEQNYADPKVQAQFLEMLQTPAAKRDNSEDKLRTFLILTLLADLPPSFVTQCEEIFASQPSVDMHAFKYILKLKQMANLLRNISLNEPVGHASGAFDLANNLALFNGLLSKLYGLTEGRISEGVTSFVSGLKKLLPEKKNLPITNVVEAIMDPANASSNSVQLTDDYLYLDPKSRGGHLKPPKRQLYQEALVFVVGGGNYLEYQNLTEWLTAPNRPSKLIIYGSTDIVTAKEFLAEAADLGRLEG